MTSQPSKQTIAINMLPNISQSKANQGMKLQSVYNILRLLDVLPNFPFTTSETMGDYYL